MLKSKRTVSRTSFAFPYFPTALQGCAMRIDPDQPFDEGVSVFMHSFSPGSEEPQIEVSFRLKLSELARQAGLDPRVVRAALVARSDELRLRRVLADFGTSEIPKNWSGRVPPEVLGSTRVEVDLVCYLDKQLSQSYERAWRRGSVFARRTWAIASPRYASLFTVTWEHFSAHEGWEEAAIWRVEFPEGERFHEVSSESAVVVALNADLPGLHSIIELAGRTSAARVTKSIVTNMIFGEILSAIVYTVVEDYRRFSREEGLVVEDLEEDRLTTRVLRFLEEHGVTESELGAGRLASLPSVTHFVQGAVDMSGEFDVTAWERLAK